MVQIRGCTERTDVGTRMTEVLDVIKVKYAVTVSQSNAGKQIVYLMTVEANREKKYLFRSEIEVSGRRVKTVYVMSHTLRELSTHPPHVERKLRAKSKSISSSKKMKSRNNQHCLQMKGQYMLTTKWTTMKR